MGSRLAVFAALTVASCMNLEAKQSTEPASVSAFSDQAAILLKPGERRVLAIQVLDAAGTGVNGVPVVFIRPKSELLRFDMDSDGNMETLTTQTANNTAFGFSGSGIALCAVTAALTTAGGTAEVLAGVVPPDPGDAGARFVTIQVSVASTDAGGPTDAGTSALGKGDAQ